MSRVLDRTNYQRSVGGLGEQTQMEKQPSDQSQEEAYKEDDGEKCDQHGFVPLYLAVGNRLLSAVSESSTFPCFPTHR